MSSILCDEATAPLGNTTQLLDKFTEFDLIAAFDGDSETAASNTESSCLMFCETVAFGGTNLGFGVSLTDSVLETVGCDFGFKDFVFIFRGFADTFNLLFWS